MHKAVCGGIAFNIKGGKSPTHLHGKYSVGKVSGDKLILKPLEALYLFSRQKIGPENRDLDGMYALLPVLLGEDEFLYRYRVFEHLKASGFQVNVEPDAMYFRRRGENTSRGPLMVRMESMADSFVEIYRRAPCIYAVVDEQDDMTIYEVTRTEPSGQRKDSWPESLECRKAGDRYVVPSTSLPDWFGEEMGDARVLNATEMRALAALVPGSRGMGAGSMAKEELLDRVFADMVSRGCIVKTGFKYGSNFRVYSRSIEDHAEMLLSVFDTDEWFKISRAVRVAHAVRKKMVFAGIVENALRYIQVERVKDFSGKVSQETS